METAIIGGTGVYDPHILKDLREEVVRTPYGEVSVRVGSFLGREVAFLARHGQGHAIPPHRINYRANIWALKMLGVRQILATSAVGSLNRRLHPGECVLLDQFIDFTKGRPSTFYDGGEAGVVHVDYTEPYCPELRRLLLRAAKDAAVCLFPRATYVCTEGPRYETPAEIRMFQRLGGDLVGMTNVPEVVLAREAEICYAAIALVTNWAAGISPTPLTHREVMEAMAANTEKLRSLLRKTLEQMPAGRECGCHHAIRELGQF